MDKMAELRHQVFLRALFLAYANEAFSGRCTPDASASHDHAVDEFDRALDRYVAHRNNNPA